MQCRLCRHTSHHVVLDLLMSPVANSFIAPEDADLPEPYFPLKVMVCDRCFLVQLQESLSVEQIFNQDYVYFSSVNEGFVRHAERYVANLVEDFGLDRSSFVVEAASNDGYLLQFVRDRGIRCLGVEPSGSTAKAAQERGIDTAIEFFTEEFARRIVEGSGKADILIGNNVLAHVPDINDFISGIATILADEGVAVIEFPHLLNLVRERQFDTVYHEHFSYLSLVATSAAFERHGMFIFRVDEQPVHGGSLRIYAAKRSSSHAVEESYHRVLAAEKKARLDCLSGFAGMQDDVDRICIDFMRFLVEARANGRTVVGYGAAAKGNTFLNCCGVKPYLMQACIDVTPAKQGKLLPGSRIPVYAEDWLSHIKPDYIVVLPWNWGNEIRSRLSYASQWGAQFVTAIPELRVTPA
jgi:SAM-dependent methyltransferase